VPLTTGFLQALRARQRPVQRLLGTAGAANSATGSCLRRTETTYLGNDLPSSEEVVAGGTSALARQYTYLGDRLATDTRGSLPDLACLYDGYGELLRAYPADPALTGAAQYAAGSAYTRNANGEVTGEVGPQFALAEAGLTVHPEISRNRYPGGLERRDARLVHGSSVRHTFIASAGYDRGGAADFVGWLDPADSWRYPYVVDTRDSLGMPRYVDRGRGDPSPAYLWHRRDEVGNLREHWLATEPFRDDTPTDPWRLLLLAEDSEGTPSVTCYDPLNRLLRFEAETPVSAPTTTQFTYSTCFGFLLSDGTATYTCDLFGNRLSRTEAGTTETYSYTVGGSHDPLHRLQSVTAGGVTTAFTYDARGNLATRTVGTATTEYTWDDAGRLTAVGPSSPAAGQKRVQYGYDVLDRLVCRSEETWDGTAWGSPVATHIVYDGDLPVAEFDGAGNLLREMVWDPSAAGGVGGLVLLRTPQGIYRPICDVRGNPLALLDQSGDIAESYRYDGFGRMRVFDGTGTELTASALGNPFGFACKRYDPSTALCHFGARWYDPALGRFLSPDPLGFVDGPNRYAYCAGDPVNFVDPWGLTSQGVGLWQYARDVAWQGRGLARGAFVDLPLHALAGMTDTALGAYVLSVECGGAIFGAEGEADAIVHSTLTALDDWRLRGSGTSAALADAENADIQAMVGTAFAPGFMLYDQYLLSMEGKHYRAGRSAGEAWGTVGLLASAVADGKPAFGWAESLMGWFRGPGSGAGVRTQPIRIYSARELIRRAEDPGPFHDFPESFNQQILEQGTRTVTPSFYRVPRPGLATDGVMYRLPGSITVPGDVPGVPNVINGTYEIGVRPSVSGNTEVIMHRFFRPNP